MKNYILFNCVIFLSFQMLNSGEAVFLSWVRSTLLPKKMEQYFSAKNTEEEFVLRKKIYEERIKGYFSFVKNDELPKSSDTSILYHNLGPDRLTVHDDRDTLKITAGLILKYIWESSDGRVRTNYYYLRPHSFESCPIPDIYNILVERVNDNAKTRVFSDLKS